MKSDSNFTLYTYCIPFDDGAAPNPFWGICTLVICKPVIRRVAKIGDWIVGTGSKNSPIGDKSKHVVYAMKVTNKMTLEEYDEFCQKHCPNKIPDWDNEDYRRRLGDCLYDFSSKPPIMRKGVHNENNLERDLGGEYALLSSHFYYFGDSPIELTQDLLPIIKEGRAHRSKSNNSYRESFVSWIKGQRLEPNVLHGNPQLRIFENNEVISKCAEYRCEEADIDERIGIDCE